MKENYLLIQSRDPFECREVNHDFQLALDLAGAGNRTTLFLVQNGVLPARKGSQHLKELVDHGIEVICDEFSLRERGMYSNTITDGVKTGPLDIVLEHLCNHSKTIWL